MELGFVYTNKVCFDESADDDPRATVAASGSPDDTATPAASKPSGKRDRRSPEGMAAEREIELPTGRLGLTFEVGTTRVGSVSETCTIRNQINAGETVVAFARSGIDGRVSCAQMTDTDAVQWLSTYKDEPGRRMFVVPPALVVPYATARADWLRAARTDTADQPVVLEAIVVVQGEAPPAYEEPPAYQPPAYQDDLGARVQRMQMELDLPEDIVNDLLSLAGSDLVVIADDSASMNLVAEPGSGSVLTRWDELKNTCGDAASPDLLVV